MDTKEMVYAYLETLLKLSDASAVNLHFFKHGVSGEDFVCFRGTGLLPEFDNKREKIVLPSLGDDNAEQKKSPLTIIHGSKDNSILINLYLTSLNSLNLSTTSNFANCPDRRESVISAAIKPVTFWLGFDFDDVGPSWLTPGALSCADSSDLSHYELFNSLLSLGALLLDHVDKTSKLLSDPLTSFSGRVKFQNDLAQFIPQYPHVALILISPNEFQQINKKFGHASGDQVIMAIAQILSASLRETDLISRFGGALFAIATPVNGSQEVMTLSKKLQLQLQQPLFLDGATHLEMSIGASVLRVNGSNRPPSELVAELIEQADLALRSAQAESLSNLVIWHPTHHEKYQHQADYIGGIFTADSATDYRNMLLLWDISNLVTSCNKFELMLTKMLQRLAKTFSISSGGLLQCDNEEQLIATTIFNVGDQGKVNSLDECSAELKRIFFDVVKDIYQHQRLCKRVKGNTVVYASPVDGLHGEIFVVVGTSDILELTNESQLLLAALAKQLGRALARVRLEEQLNQQLYDQKQKLQAELNELKQSAQSSCIYYCSQPMQELMKQAQRVAATDATTLIIGESGTGKERLVNAIHQMGPRHNKPLVIVDCGAIPETLIESELFGHVKGAYTGAQSQTKGRILEAAGGTLMLDEIGELPLQVQSKLLRFVQEKQFTPVGGSKATNVNVKIIAVTNRELLDEVHQGRFREDLFYRLNVLELRAPPLRDRPDDIPLLVKYFLKKFSQQFDVPIHTVSTQIFEKMQQYSWPGNVRELENRLMQATLLGNGDTIEFSDFHINDNDLKIDLESEINNVTPAKPTGLVRYGDGDISQQNSTQLVAAAQVYLQEIKATLSWYVRQLVQDSLETQMPLGRWLDDDLIIATYNSCAKNARQAALRLGLPHSTLRRRVINIDNQRNGTMPLRADGWQKVMTSLTPVIEGMVRLGANTIKQLKLTLLSCIVEIVPGNAAIASALLGVSEPTFYKWKKELIEWQNDDTELSPAQPAMCT